MHCNEMLIRCNLATNCCQSAHKSWCVTHIDHVSPAFCVSAKQRFIVGQTSVVDAHVHSLMKCLNGREHGQDLVLITQVTLIRDQRAAVSCTLTFSCQLLCREKTWADVWMSLPEQNSNKTHFNEETLLCYDSKTVWCVIKYSAHETLSIALGEHTLINNSATDSQQRNWSIKTKHLTVCSWELGR